VTTVRVITAHRCLLLLIMAWSKRRHHRHLGGVWLKSSCRRQGDQPVAEGWAACEEGGGCVYGLDGWTRQFSKVSMLVSRK
jgi:hypothetical protein